MTAGLAVGGLGVGGWGLVAALQSSESRNLRVPRAMRNQTVVINLRDLLDKWTLLV